jgi:hypothetical protein
MHSVMHGAADDIQAARITLAQAAPYITKTLLAAFAPPGTQDPN